MRTKSDVETVQSHGMSSSRRLFAIIPAAGHSRRMGRPKLLLPLDGQTVIRRLLNVLGHESIAARFVVMRRDDDDLANEVRNSQAKIVQPAVDPPDMRQSIEFGLREVECTMQPTADDGWLLVPADHPMLDSTILRSLIDYWSQNPDRIVVPEYGGRRGHPTIFPWRLAEAVKQLPENAGLNLLLKAHAGSVAEVPVESPTVLTDLDTPEDYELLLRTFSSRRDD